MEVREQKEVLDKIKNIKELNSKNELYKVNEIIQLADINEKLLKIIKKELETEKVPSKEVLDTIQISLIISAVLPWNS